VSGETAQAALFEPLTIRELSVRNRIWVAPMCQYAIRDHTGIPGDWHLVHLGAMAVGRPGLVLAEATGVSPEARISDADTGLWSDAHCDAWSRIADFVHAQGVPLGVQLAHAGRKASTYPEWGSTTHGTIPIDEGGWTTISSSDVAFDRDGYLAPVALDLAGIDKVVDDFAAAARYAMRAGFDVVEIHAAHGYLIHQFLSPLANSRTDDYGASLENRARLLLRVVRVVRDAIGPSVPLFVRFSGLDYVEGGWTLEQTAEVAGWAQAAGADLFDITSGGIIYGRDWKTGTVEIPVGPGYQVPFATFVKEHAGVPVSAVGLITQPRQASEIIASGQADAVMLGREMLRNPRFPLLAAHELGVAVDYWPPQYAFARPR
jgi:2,4-dienoyl-CoA reductase-like NADH-dependent reductase (Old Yellow Enzyme family)